MQSWKNVHATTKLALCKWVHFERVKPILKILLVLWERIMLLGGLDLFKEELWVSVGQRAAKLLSVKLWGWSHHPGLKPG